MGAIQRRLWFVRHGYRQDYCDPRWKKNAAFPRDTPLSSQGLVQAQDLVSRFLGEPIDAVYVSPYLRTLQTLEPLAIALAGSIPLNVEPGLGEIVMDPNLHDGINFPVQQRLKSYPSLNSQYQSLWHPSEVETPMAAMHRASSILSMILENTSGNLLIVSHESPIRGMVQTLTFPKQRVRCSFCGVTELLLNNNTWQLISNGDTSHLSSPTTRWTFFRDYCVRQVLA